MTIDAIIDQVKKYNCKLVEITGGEPLFQDECFELMKQLCDKGFDVMLETGGSLPIQSVDKRVMIILDLKCPSSNMIKKNLFDNLDYIKQFDEIKFVIGTLEDYKWAKEIIGKYKLFKKCSILFSVVFGLLEPVKLVEWILKDNLQVRFQLQVHKFIWEPNKKGV